MSNGAQDTARIPTVEDGPPPKRQKVLSRACEACKSKKSKCDSNRPQCESCRRKGTECIYREKGQPGLRPGYGRGIEQRVASLEQSIERMNQNMQEALAAVRQGSLTTSSLRQQPEAMPPVDLRPGEEAPVRLAAVTTNTPPSQDAVSFSSTPLMDQLPWLNISHQPILDTALPRLEILQELAELFFESIYPWFRLFFKPTFMAKLTSPDRQILLWGLVAVSFRFWKKPNPPVEVREQYVKTARERILLHSVDNCSVISTQALCLLALEAVGQGPGPRTWSIMAVLIAAVPQLGLAKSAIPATNQEINHPMVRNESPDETLNLASIEMEEKRRLFWCIYILDRFSSYFHGKLCGIDPKSIRVQYPADDREWGQISTAEWFHVAVPLRSHVDYASNLWRCQIEILALSDRTHQLLLQPVNLSLPAKCQEWHSSFRLLDSTLTTWFENLPNDVRDTPTEFNPMWVMVHATYHAVVMRMHAVAAFPSTSSPYFRPYPSACSRCRQAVRSVESLASRLQPHELDQLGPIFAFTVWCAARALVILWTTGYENTYGSTPADLHSLLSVLRQMSSRWQCAEQYADTVQFILDTKNKPGASLRIFNDTGRTVYGLRQHLGTLIAGHNSAKQVGGPLFELLDMPVLEEPLFSSCQPLLGNDFGGFGPEFEGEWM